eukprot:317327-Pyramimonas_sp.AAC.1
MDKAVRKYAGRFGLDAAGLLQAASVKKEEPQNSCQNRPLPALLPRLLAQALLRLQLLHAVLLP